MLGRNHMETLLLEEDSSSGESNDEQERNWLPRNGAINDPVPACVSASVHFTQQKQQQKQTGASAALTATSFQAPSSSQSEVSMRLKSLYSPASKIREGQARPFVLMQVPLLPAPPSFSSSSSTGSLPCPVVLPIETPKSRSISAPRTQNNQKQQQSSPMRPYQHPRRHLVRTTRPFQTFTLQQTSSNEQYTQSSTVPQDPFEPISLREINERQKRKLAVVETPHRVGGPTSSPRVQPPALIRGKSITSCQQEQQQPTHSPRTMVNHFPWSTVKGPNDSVVTEIPTATLNNKAVNHPVVAVNNIVNNRDFAKRQKEMFYTFVRILRMYLEKKDPTMYLKLNAVIQDLATQNKRPEAGFEIDMISLKQRLHDIVGEAHWACAESYFAKHLKLKGQLELDKRQKPHQRNEKRGQCDKEMENARKLQQQPKQQQNQIQHAAPSSEMVIAVPVKAVHPLLAARMIPPGMLHDAKAQRQSLIQAGTSSSINDSSTPPLSNDIPSQQQQSTEVTTSKPHEILAPVATTDRLQRSPMPPKNPTVIPPAESTATAKKGSKKGTNADAAPKRSRASPSLDTAKSRSPSRAHKATSATTPVRAKTATKLSVADAALLQQQQQQHKIVPPPREYNEFMEMVDHAVNFDWTTAGLLSSSKNSAELSLTEAQQKLLFGDNDDSAPVRKPIAFASNLPVALQGWSQRNLVTSRVAWAKVRLPEIQQQNIGARSLTTPAAPVVGGGLLTLPSSPSNQTVESLASSSPSMTSRHKWINEIHAGEDMTLAILSQGAEIYVKTLIEKALHCARQRQNLDAFRLWHQQHAAGVVGGNGNFGASHGTPPPLSLRLGCDVRRQVAQVQGNSAMTCKRMEEALARRPQPRQVEDRVLNQTTLANASSMADLSLRPALAKAVETADVAGKRSFEVYGGKDTDQPPFGRVPKQAKLQLVDFTNGMELVSPTLQASQRQAV